MLEGRENWPQHQEEKDLGSVRLKRVLEIDRGLEVTDELGRGSTAIVYNCRKDNQDGALKVSIMAEGISDGEFAALKDLGLLRGTPEVVSEYRDDNRRIALLLKKIEGEQLDEFLSKNRNAISEVFQKIR